MACCRTLIEAIDNEHFDCIKNVSHTKFPKTFFSFVYENIHDTSLVLAAQLGKTQLVTKLIPMCTNSIIHVALIVAAEQGKCKVVKQLLFAIEYPLGNYQESPLSAAIENNHVECVKILLKNGTNVNYETVYGWRPIHWAAKTGNSYYISLLFQHGACINAEDINGRTPLHLAVKFNHVECVRLLLNMTQNEKTLLPIGELLRVAIKHTSHNCLSLLLGLNPDLQILVDAIADALGTDWTFIKPLLTKVAEWGPIKNIFGLYTTNGSTILHEASKSNNTLYLDLFVSMGADVNVRDKNGYTPLYAASTKNKICSVLTLLGYGNTAYTELGCFKSNPRVKLAIAKLPISQVLGDLLSALLEVNLDDHLPNCQWYILCTFFH